MAEIAIFSVVEFSPRLQPRSPTFRACRVPLLYFLFNPFPSSYSSLSRPPKAVLGAFKQLSEAVSSVILMPCPYVGNIGLLPVFDSV